MQEPSLRTSRLAIAGSLAAAIAIAAAGFFLGRTTSPSPKISERRVPDVVAPTQKIETPSVLGRADLISLTNRAADALASGGPMPAELTEAAGRRFELVLPFGCNGPAMEGSSAKLSWRFDERDQTLRVRVAATVWQPGDWGLPSAESPGKTIEGFWVDRPWASSDECPQFQGEGPPADAQPVTLPGQTLAVAQLSEKSLNNGRPYETVLRLTEDTVSKPKGFRLRLTGRIESGPGGAAVSCKQPAGIDQRPVCLVQVTFEEIRIEDPTSTQPLATWPARAGS